MGCSLSPFGAAACSSRPKLCVCQLASRLWEQGDDPVFGSVNGRPALSSTQVQNNTVLFACWSDCVIAQWAAVDVLSNKYTYATTAEVEITANLLCDVQFKYALSFCASNDSGAQ